MEKDNVESNRYEYLLNQISQLNNDLHKTAAHCTAIKEEKEYLNTNCNQVPHFIYAIDLNLIWY